MKTLINFAGPLLFLISFFFPKERKLWLYGSWFGERYSDNSKDFFEFSNSIKDKNIEHYWIYKNVSLKKIIEEKGYKCAYAYSLKGILLQLRAKVYITCINSSDFVPFLLTPRNYFVQLWHGSPIKHIGLDSRTGKIRKAIDLLRFKTLDDYSLIVSPSENVDEIYQRAFYKNKNRIYRCGYPRNENLIINSKRKQEIREFFRIKKDEKLVSYLPTHRNEGKGENTFRNILRELILYDKFLQQNKIKIIVKPHFYERDSLNGIEESSNVLIRYDLPFDLYEFLGATDILITDYSSVMFDYELLNKKIIVFPFDYETYTTKDRSLYFNYDFIYQNVMNVEKVNSIEDLCSNLLKKKDDSKEDKVVKSLFNVPLGAYSKTIYYKVLQDISL